MKQESSPFFKILSKSGKLTFEFLEKTKNLFFQLERIEIQWTFETGFSLAHSVLPDGVPPNVILLCRKDQV
ncbi:hypothetical protein CH380_19935 [Leptospira adleri]|uniref:Uncharacterized protein n=1 Tax=Leptospira adleri TaxID=2023186 RepID=A0A2M9YIU2_9LEPT|nr:hypothetical protein CH380_19935 [Leptospira adleri]PJZ61671.1 hypothetical protein CH376_11815 [Leptospira adleri]